MNDPLAAVSVGELRSLAAALEAGRVGSPLSLLALETYLKRDAATAAPVLVKLSLEGMSAAHLAFFLNALAAEREARLNSLNSIELVTTGPEAVGNPTRETRIVVRELFRQARQSVIVAGYAVYQGRDVFEALAATMAAVPDLQVRMFLDVERGRRDTSLPSEILRLFARRFKASEWPGSRLPEVYYDPRSLEPEAPKRASLHAKCVVVDQQAAFISSANFTEAAQARNIEVGVLLRSSAVAEQLASHFAVLADRKALLRVPGL